MWCHPSCAFLCLLSCLLICFLLLYMHLRACLIFCSDFMLCLIVFSSQFHTFVFSCVYAGCCQCHFLDLSDFLCAHFPFCCFCSPFIVFTLLHAFSFALLQLYLVFFCSIQWLIFLHCKSAGYTNLCLLVFVFFCVVVCFSAFYLRIHIHIAPSIRCFGIIPPLNPLWPPSPPLTITWCFVACHHTSKICPDRRFCLASPCFPAPPCKYDLLPPCDPICTHPEPFAIILVLFGKTWCSGKFPRS